MWTNMAVNFFSVGNCRALLHPEYIHMHTCPAANFGAQRFSATSFPANLHVCMFGLFVKMQLIRWKVKNESWVNHCNHQQICWIFTIQLPTPAFPQNFVGVAQILCPHQSKQFLLQMCSRKCNNFMTVFKCLAKMQCCNYMQCYCTDSLGLCIPEM